MSPRLYNTCNLFLHFILLISSISCREISEVSHKSSSCPVNINDVESIDDLDLERCDLAELSIPELRRICYLVGLDVEDEVFPYLVNEQQVPMSKDVSKLQKADYVIAAKECLSLKEEMEVMLEQDQELEKNLLQEDPGLLAEVMSDILTTDPQLYEKIVEYIQRDEPELYQELVEEADSSIDGNFSRNILKSLTNHPDLIADFVEQMLVTDPNFFDVVDEADLPTGGLENYFQMNEDEAEDDIEEDVKALLDNINKGHDGNEL